MIAAQEVTELRTTYNGSFGASLLFHADERIYYATIFQDGRFWQVVRTVSDKQAEAAFRRFADRTIELATIEMQQIRLQADYAQNEKILRRRHAQLDTLRADEAVRQEQEQAVLARQAATRQQAEALAERQADLARQLTELQKEIAALETVKPEQVGRHSSGRR